MDLHVQFKQGERLRHVVSTDQLIRPRVESVLVEREIRFVLADRGQDLGGMVETQATDLSAETVKRGGDSLTFAVAYCHEVPRHTDLCRGFLQECCRRSIVLEVRIQKLTRIARYPGVSGNTI